MDWQAIIGAASGLGIGGIVTLVVSLYKAHTVKKKDNADGWKDIAERESSQIAELLERVRGLEEQIKKLENIILHKDRNEFERAFYVAVLEKALTDAEIPLPDIAPPTAP